MKPINRTEIAEIFGNYSTMYKIAGRRTDSYLMKKGIWDEHGNLTGKTPAERYSRISLLITAYVCHKGSLKGIPQHWLKFANEQKL